MKQMAADPSTPARLPENQSDELGLMARTFNQMADSLGESQQVLEQRVAERTRELGSAKEMAETPKGFYGQLSRGQVPGWLRPIALPKDNPYRMYKIVG